MVRKPKLLSFMENHCSLSILMFPWLAHGHISPFLELGKKLAKRNFTIYLCSTSATLTCIKKKLCGTFSKSINLVELHLPEFSNLPPHYQTTNGLPPELMPTLKEAFNMARPNFYEILLTLKPDLLIYDSLQPWAPKAAFELNIPAVDFITSSSVMTCLMMHVLKNRGIKFPSSSIFYRSHEAVIEKELFDDVERHGVEKLPVIECIEQSCNVILIKGVNEIDGKYSDYLNKLTGKKVVAVGPLVQEPTNYDDENESLEIIKWLNKKEKRSTIFVSFGSEYFLSKEDREEIAHGLERSNLNFILVIRFPKGDNVKLEEALPKGFFKRVGERGRVVEGWAPQAKILSHSSTGAFLSHCGWSSILESMKYGVPIIAMPMQLDQPINARLVGEVGAGVEVLRDREGKLHREKLAAVIKQVMKGETGELVRKQVKHLQDKIEERGEEDIDKVVDELVQVCLKNKKINGFANISIDVSIQLFDNSF